jgi:hypothetical protein
MKSLCLVLAQCTLVGLLSGCAQYQWQKSGASRADLDRDSWNCEVESARAYPNPTQSTAGYYATPATTQCTGSGSGSTYNTTCTTTPGMYVDTSSFSASVRREEAQKRCMAARGWRRVQVK